MSNIHLSRVHQLGNRFILHSFKSSTNYSHGQSQALLLSQSPSTKLKLSTSHAQSKRQKGSDRNGKSPPPLFTDKTLSQQEGTTTTSKSVFAPEEPPHVTNIRKILSSRRLDPMQLAPQSDAQNNVQPPAAGGINRNMVTKSVKMNLETGNSDSGRTEKVSEGNSDSTSDGDDLLTPPTNCCMSGCPNCVWIEYVERLTNHYSDPSLGREKIREDINSIPDANIRALLIMELKFRGLW